MSLDRVPNPPMPGIPREIAIQPTAPDPAEGFVLWIDTSQTIGIN